MRATSCMPVMFPKDAGGEPPWFVATPRGAVALTLSQLEDALWQGHVGATTLVTRAGMPTWYTLGVLTGFADQRARLADQHDEACVAVTDAGAIRESSDARSGVSRLLVAVGACLLLVAMLAGLAAGPRSMQGYKALVVTASDVVVGQASQARDLVRQFVEQQRGR